MFISLHASELFSLGHIGLIPLELFTNPNINRNYSVHINIPCKAFLKRNILITLRKIDYEQVFNLGPVSSYLETGIFIHAQ